jgi:nucleoside-diphosphate-sugar epimerase
MGSIIVVGARGYIGSRIASQPVFKGGGWGTSRSGEGGYAVLKLEAPEDFDTARIRDGDIVALTAAVSSPDLCSNRHDYAYAVNVTGSTALIARVIDRGARVVFFSSDTVYGFSKEPVDETSELNPAGPYAHMKVELESRFIGNPSFKTLRLSYVFSRSDKFTRYLLECAQRGDTAEVFDPFERAVVYLNDVVDAVLAIAADWSRVASPVVNLGGPQLISRKAMVAGIKAKAIPSLGYRIVEPSEEFFQNRPTTINMVSPLLAPLLGRKASSLESAITQEFP